MTSGGYRHDGERVEDLLRRLAPRVLAALVRRHDDFEAAEDAVQEARLTTSLPEQRYLQDRAARLERNTDAPQR
ncbi:hypothetical protein ACIBBB_00820 [Streptomyces sp. NPDC051217]|uniref:hypothetical protein n=1 Tax=Streptomyces sp. NPDC051217 TaxID=3365644 RepID=UPI003795EE6F